MLSVRRSWWRVGQSRLIIRRRRIAEPIRWKGGGDPVFIILAREEIRGVLMRNFFVVLPGMGVE
jgi:hypothetical protein